MINSFDRWCREMAGMSRHLLKERKKDTEPLQDLENRPKKAERLRKDQRLKRHGLNEL